MVRRHLLRLATLFLILLVLSGCAFYGGYAYYDPPPVYGYFGYYHSDHDGHHHSGNGDRWDRGHHYGNR